jgi:beta-lactam-binding protein with PASTA domain
VSISFPTKIGKLATLNGNVADQKTSRGTSSTDIEHLIKIGTMIEDNADRFVEMVRGIYVSKMKDILSRLKVDTEYAPTQEAMDYLAAGMKKP